MGLDMFLMAKKNFYCDNDSSDGEQEKIQSIFPDVPFKITQIKGEAIINDAILDGKLTKILLNKFEKLNNKS